MVLYRTLEAALHALVRFPADGQDVLRLCSDEVKEDRDLVQACLESDYLAFRYVPPTLRADDEIINAYIKSDPDVNLIGYIEGPRANDVELWKRFVAAQPARISGVPRDCSVVRLDPEWVAETVFNQYKAQIDDGEPICLYNICPEYLQDSPIVQDAASKFARWFPTKFPRNRDDAFVERVVRDRIKYNEFVKNSTATLAPFDTEWFPPCVSIRLFPYYPNKQNLTERRVVPYLLCMRRVGRGDIIGLPPMPMEMVLKILSFIAWFDAAVGMNLPPETLVGEWTTYTERGAYYPPAACRTQHAKDLFRVLVDEGRIFSHTAAEAAREAQYARDALAWSVGTAEDVF